MPYTQCLPLPPDIPLLLDETSEMTTMADSTKITPSRATMPMRYESGTVCDGSTSVQRNEMTSPADNVKHCNYTNISTIANEIVRDYKSSDAEYGDA